MKLIYDQGTLLILDGPHDLALLCPHFLWDSRIEGFRAPAYKYFEIKKFFNTQRTFTLEDHVPPDPLKPATQIWYLPELRPYQASALEEWRNNNHQGIVVLPTGAGKTLLAFAAISHTQERTLCLVPTRALLEQWCHEIKKYYKDPIGIQGDGCHTLETITVSTYESAYRHIAQYGHYFNLIIIDECHHFGIGLRDEILKMSTAAFRLGLTATPPLSSLPDGTRNASQLIELIGPIVFELGLSDLTGSYLAEFQHYTLTLQLTPEERFQYESEMRLYKQMNVLFRNTCSQGTYTDWIRFASRSKEGQNALKSFQKAKKIVSFCQAKANALNSLLKSHWAQKILIFTANNEMTYIISKNHFIAPITSEIGRKERTEILKNYRSGQIRALVSCRVLNEGLDVPDAEIAIIMGGTSGTREHIQRIGRILRPHPGKKAILYELICHNTFEVQQARRRSQLLGSTNTTAD